MNRFCHFIRSAAVVLMLSGCVSTPEPELPERSAADEKDYINASVMVQVMNILNRHYIDEKKVTADQLFEAALKGMVSSLDPYSGYEPPKDFRQLDSKRTGELTGIGINIIKPPSKYLYVLDVIPGSPAAAAKIMPGDNIKSINGKDLRKLNLFQCQQLLQGPAGSRVTVDTVSGGKIIRKTLIRKKVINPSVNAVKVINSHIGYIRIASFTPHTPLEFMKAVKKLKKEEIDGLIIDLRNNTGGHVKAATETLSQLLAPGTVLFTASRRNSKKTETLRSRKYRNVTADTQTPVVLLVNNFTASSAELFSGAMRDHKRAQTVGSRTFGKGTLLNVIRLANGGALRFSSGKYKTPAGTEIEGKGLMPEHRIQLSLKEMQQLAMQGRRFPGVIKPEIKNALTDRQLEKAVELLTSDEEDSFFTEEENDEI